MTNGEKYKSANERTKAFFRSYKGYIHDAVYEFSKWLDLEAEDEMTAAEHGGVIVNDEVRWLKRDIERLRVALRAVLDCDESSIVSLRDAVRSAKRIAKKEAN